MSIVDSNKSDVAPITTNHKVVLKNIVSLTSKLELAKKKKRTFNRCFRHDPKSKKSMHLRTCSLSH